MAYVVRNKTEYFNGVSSFTPSLPAHENGDLILIFMSNDWTNNTYSTVTSGWTKEVEESGGAVAACFSFYALGSGSTNPTFTTGTARDCVATAVVIKGAPTSSAIDTSGSTQGSTFRSTTQTVTTTTNNCLLLEYVMLETRSKQLFFEPEVALIAQTNGGPIAGNYSGVLGWHIQQTAGLSTGHTYANSFSSNSGAKLTIAIKDDGNADLVGYVDPTTPPAELITPWANAANLSYYDDGTKAVDPTSLIGTIDGVSTTYKAAAANGVITPSINGTGYSITSSGDWNKRLIFQRGLGNSWDLSGGALVSFSMLSEDKSVDFSTGARYLGFGSGDTSNVATAAELFQFESSDSKVTADDGIAQFVIQPSKTSDASFGSIDLTNIVKLFHSAYVTSSDQDAGVGFIYKLSDMVLTGGSVAFPCSLLAASVHSETSALNTIKNQKGSSTGQYFCSQNIQVGSTNDSTYWDNSFQSVEYPSSYNSADVNIAVNTNSAALKFNVKPKSGDTVRMLNSTFNMGDFHRWEIDSSAVDADIYNFSGLNVLNATVTLQALSNVDYSGITFAGCKELTTNSADLSGGVTISSCVDTYAITVTTEAEFNNLHNCIFKGNNYSIKITGNHGGDTWSATGMTVATGTGSYDIRYEGTGTLTIEVDIGSGFSQGRSEASVGTLTISSPTTTLTVNSSEAGSDIKIFNTTTQTIEASATGTTASTTAAGTYDWTVQKAGYLPQRGTGVVLSASSVTVDITLIEDPVYNASHGLTFTTDYSYDASTRIMTIVANQEGRNLYSALIDDFISETALRNCPFPLTAVGPDRVDFKAIGYYNSATTVGATIDSGDVTFWKGAGMEWEHDTTGNPTKKFYSIKSANTLQASSVVGYTQVNNGTPVEATLVSNQVNQVVQFFEDTNGDGSADYSYTGHLLFKGFKTGYYQARWDVINDSGITTLEAYEYTINLLQEAIAGATGDQAVTITTLTDHTGAPKVVSGKSFDYELVDPAVTTGENLLAQYNYDVFTAVSTAIAGTLYTSYKAFDLPDIIIEAGTAYETEYGRFEGDGAVTDYSGIYVSQSAADHPDFTRHQSNDGTYYVKPITANITISNLPDDVGGDTRLQIYNTTTATLIYSGDPSGTGYTDSYTDGDAAYASSGDSVRIRFAHANAGTSFEWGETIVTATSDGIVANGDNFVEVDAVYATNAIDGSTVAKFNYDSVGDQFNLAIASNFTAAEMFAFYCYTLTTATGIEGAFGAFEAVDAGNYKNITAIADIFLDNETTASKRQTDTARIYKDDGSYPVLDPTTSGFGIDINWQNVVYVVTAGSGLTAGQASELTAAASTSTFNPTVDELETGETYAEAMRLMRAEAAGKVAVSGSTVSFRDANDTKDRIVATVDTNGQRTAVTTDGS